VTAKLLCWFHADLEPSGTSQEHPNFSLCLSFETELSGRTQAWVSLQSSPDWTPKLRSTELCSDEVWSSAAWRVHLCRVQLGTAPCSSTIQLPSRQRCQQRLGLAHGRATTCPQTSSPPSAFSAVTSYPQLYDTSRNFYSQKSYPSLCSCRENIALFCANSPCLAAVLCKPLCFQPLAADLSSRECARGGQGKRPQPAPKAAAGKASRGAHTALAGLALIWDNKQPHSSSPNSEILCYINNASSYLQAVCLQYSLTWAVQRPYGHCNLFSEAETDWKCRVLKAVQGEMLAKILRHFFSSGLVWSPTVWSVGHPASTCPQGGLVKGGSSCHHLCCQTEREVLFEGSLGWLSRIQKCSQIVVLCKCSTTATIPL